MKHERCGATIVVNGKTWVCIKPEHENGHYYVRKWPETDH